MTFLLLGMSTALAKRFSRAVLIATELRPRRRSVAETIRIWLARSQQRHDLRELVERNDHLLRDIGVPREAALREAAKPFWRK
jgi:uncharacterized protein YjiS (DUF1127 family)